MLHSVHMQGEMGRARPANVAQVVLVNPEEVYSPGALSSDVLR